MNVGSASRYVRHVGQEAVRGARDGAQWAPLALYEEHFELSQEVGLSEVYCPAAWVDSHPLTCSVVRLVGSIVGGAIGVAHALVDGGATRL